MKINSRTLAICLMLIVLGSALVFSQVGGDKRPTTPRRKTSPPKTTPATQPSKRTTTRGTSGSSSRATSRRTAPNIEMVLIPAGKFVMGSSETEIQDAFADINTRFNNNPTIELFNGEIPPHRVSVPAFYMGKYEVTQAQYRAVMGDHSSNFTGDNLPVDLLSWNDAVEFCRRLSKMTGREYRLPTEAEWEYACRSGTTTSFAFGSSLSSEQANFSGYPYGGAPRGANRETTMPVGSFPPNAFGLHDMHGNISEWCLDYWHKNYNGASSDGSAWLSGGDSNVRVLRGGAWLYDAVFCRSAERLRSEDLDFRCLICGFRVVASARTLEPS